MIEGCIVYDIGKVTYLRFGSVSRSYRIFLGRRGVVRFGKEDLFGVVFVSLRIDIVFFGFCLGGSYEFVGIEGCVGFWGFERRRRKRMAWYFLTR